METVTINNPTWDDIRDNDLVTFERGSEGEEGHTLRTERAKFTMINRLIGMYPSSYWREYCWTPVKITRDIWKTLPDHNGALVFTNAGLSLSDGNGSDRWCIEGEFYTFTELKNPTEALPAPAQELRDLDAAITGGETIHDVYLIASSLIDATHREWNRARIDGRLSN